MQYGRVYNHSLFLSEGKVFRKASNAFAVDVVGGTDAIFDLRDDVQPVNKDVASEVSGIHPRYL